MAAGGEIIREEADERSSAPRRVLPGGDRRLRTVLLVDAGFRALVGALLVLGSWDSLYELLDLPRLRPALLAQLGGVAALALGYLLWDAASTRAELGPAVAAAAIANALGFVLVLAWLVLRWDDLTTFWAVGAPGQVLLIAATALLGALAAAEFRSGVREITSRTSREAIAKEQAEARSPTR